jgi:hypothetical protein
MSTAKRRINSTGRHKIRQERIDLRLLATAEGEPAQASLSSLDLADLQLPRTAAVVVEAYQRSSAMRFDCGTVGAITIPPLVLGELDHATAALFRIKVVDVDGQAGKILASAERIRPKSDADDKGRKSIFPVRFCNLGPEIWQVEIDDVAGPILKLNSTIPGLINRIHENPLIGGTLLPAAFRLVLEFLVADTAEDDEDGPGWKGDWIRFCREELGTDDPDELPMDEDARAEWVNDAVRRFCDRIGFVDRAKQLIAEHAHA